MRAALPFILLVHASPLLLLGCPAEVRDFGNGGDGPGGGGSGTGTTSATGSTSTTSSTTGTTSTTSSTTGTTSSTGPAPMDLWVDPVGGDDEATGAQATPLKTISQALQLIKSGYRIHLLAGLYSQDNNGDVFGYTIPDGVDIDGAGPAMTILDGKGAATGFTFAGKGTIANLDMNDFGLAASATSGQVGLTQVHINMSPGGQGLSLNNTADAMLVQVDFNGGSTGVGMSTASKLTMQGGQIVGQGPNCSGGVAGISADGSASINLDGTLIQGVLGQALELRQAATAHLVKSTIDGSGPQGCGNGDAVALGESAGLTADQTIFKNSAGPAILSYGTGQINLTKCSIDANGWSGILSGDSQTSISGGSISNNQGSGIRLNGYVTIDGVMLSGNTSDAISVEQGGSLRLRGSQLINNYEGISANTSGGTESIDLGMPGDPGGNTIQNMTLGLYVGWTVTKTMPATGNTWVPGQQGTNAAGQFPGGNLCGPFGNSGSVRNIRIVNSGPCVSL